MVPFWLLLLQSTAATTEAKQDYGDGPFLGKRKRREEKDLNDLEMFLKQFLESVS